MIRANITNDGVQSVAILQPDTLRTSAKTWRIVLQHLEALDKALQRERRRFIRSL